MSERSIFLQALEIGSAEERNRYLGESCGDDPALRSRVEQLLQSYSEAGSFLKIPALEQSDAPHATPLDPTETHAAQDTPGDGSNSLSFLQPSQRPDSLGRLGHYEALEVVGRGGMGLVMRAFDKKLHRIVAIKVMAGEIATSGSGRKRFLREAKAAAAVVHDHIVPIYAIEESDSSPYLVMQFIAGKSLQQKIDDEGSLELKEILRISRQIALGLAAAHKQGLVHRDIKPSNILLENGVQRVKITDFGLARAMDDASVTHSGVIAGTPQFMSPEQADGKPVDHRSDLFSLGSVIYAMCTGRPPFRADSTMGTLKRVCEDTPRPIREINPDMPEWLCGIIAKLHAKKPDERFQSAKEVAELLEQQLAHLQQPATIQQPPPVIVPESAKPTARIDKHTWTQILEGVDYRSRLLQFGIILAALIPSYVFVAAGALGRIDYWLHRYGQGVLVGSLVVDVVWGAACLWLLGRAKHCWDVLYKGRKLRLELSAFGSERLLLDGEVIAKCGWGFSFQELQATIPNGAGAGDKIRVLGQFGFLSPICRIFASEGLPPSLVKPRSASARFRRWVRTLVWTTAALSPLVILAWFQLAQGWISIQVDDPEMIVMLDGQVYITGEKVAPNTRLYMFGRSLSMGDHTLRALKGGKAVFDKTFHIAFQQKRDFDLTRAALTRQGGSTPSGEQGWVSLFNGRDLTGWKSFPENRQSWKVINGVLTGHGEPCHLFSDRGDFESFHLRMEMRVSKNGAVGQFFRVPREDPGVLAMPHGEGNLFMLKRKVYDNDVPPDPVPPSDRTKTLGVWGYGGASDLTVRKIRDGEWFTEEIIADGPHITTNFAGDQGEHTSHVTHYRAHPRGHIALQLFDKDTVVEIRKIEIKVLPSAAKDWPRPSLDGRWVADGAEFQGNQVPLKEARFMFPSTMLIKGDQYSLSWAGKQHSGTFGIDPTKKPAEIDFSGTAFSMLFARKAIYKLDDDRLTLCLPFVGPNANPPRPTDFTTGLTSKNAVLVYRREKTDPQDQPPKPKLLKRFDPAKEKAVPPRGDPKNVSVENGAWRIVNDTNTGNFNVLLATVREGIPEDGVIICRAKVKVEAKDPIAWGSLGLGIASPSYYEYDWPSSSSYYDGKVSDWTTKEVRYPANLFIREGPPTIPISVGLHANGTLWVKDLELLHLPTAPPEPPFRRPGETVVKSFTFKDRPTESDLLFNSAQGWRYFAGETTKIRLFELPKPNVENCRLIFRARMKTAGASGVHLRMIAKFRGVVGVDDTVDTEEKPVAGAKGDNDWATYEVIMDLKAGRRPERIDLCLTMIGRDREKPLQSNFVWIKDVELLKAPLPKTGKDK